MTESIFNGSLDPPLKGVRLRSCLLIEQMRADGVTITDEPFVLGATGSRIAFVEDPDGILVELIERK